MAKGTPKSLEKTKSEKLAQFNAEKQAAANREIPPVIDQLIARRPEDALIGMDTLAADESRILPPTDGTDTFRSGSREKIEVDKKLFYEMFYALGAGYTQQYSRLSGIIKIGAMCGLATQKEAMDFYTEVMRQVRK